MKNCAIVCEYNPFHVGHKYQLDEVRRLGVDNIFCIMSGAFVQSALPAFCDKSIRAECAVTGGADAVIELPAVFATASAQAFAEGALKIISGIKNITNIAMGAVAERSDILEIADIKVTNAERFSAILKSYLNSGKSYNAASVAALSQLYNELHPDKNAIDTILTDPNNILCIEYITALNKFIPSIEPIIIRRIGAKHNDKKAIDGYISASALREMEKNGNFKKAQHFIPINYDAIRADRLTHAPDLETYKKIALYCLKTSDIEYLSQLRNCSEGLEFLLKNICNQYCFDEIIDYTVGKRYSKKRIYRLILDAVLGIDKQATSKNFCTRLLACKKDIDFSLLPACVKTDNSSIKRAAANDKDVSDVLSIDEKAVALYNTISGRNGSYFNYSLVKV